MPAEIVKRNLLVVEGRDEELFFEAFLKHLALQNIQIMGIGGKEKLRPNLKALVLSPRFSEVISLGIVRDANSDPRAAFQSIRDALQDVNLPLPNGPLLIAGSSPRVIVMILPAESAPGALEDLCLQAVNDDAAMPCVAEYFRCLQQQSVPAPRAISKAKVQAFLASRQEAGKRLGEAAQAGYWPLEHNTFAQVKDFLKQVSS